ncbi:MAG: YceI family protein [Pseudomonadota bacterium]|nr:YceI family protein [Pseudomonadota bacterium]
MHPIKTGLGCAASLALMSVSTQAWPASAPMAAPDFAAVQPGGYAVEPTHTRILFSLSHLGFTTWYGDFSHASGAATIDPAHPSASSVEVSVPVASIETTNTVLDEELKGADWFDAAKFPTLTFKSRQISATGPDEGEIVGDLTLHGVTRPVTLHVKFHGAGANPMSHAYTAGFDATGVIKRGDFGVTKYLPMVGDDVTLIISAAFERKGP